MLDKFPSVLQLKMPSHLISCCADYLCGNELTADKNHNAAQQRAMCTADMTPLCYSYWLYRICKQLPAHMYTPSKPSTAATHVGMHTYRPSIRYNSSATCISQEEETPPMEPFSGESAASVRSTLLHVACEAHFYTATEQAAERLKDIFYGHTQN